MRSLKVTFIIVASAIALYVLYCIVALVLFIVLPSPYLRFMGKDTAYYSEVAHACDLVMQQHPATSNDTVTLYQHMSLPYAKKLSTRDSSLPKIIRALHPDMILVSTNRVWIEIPPERMGGFTIAWEPDDMRTNYWVLYSNGDGLEKTVYEESRHNTTP